MVDDLINLAHVGHELHELTGAPAPPYRFLYQLVLDGKLPARSIRGRWYLMRRDLHEIAKTLAKQLSA